MSPLLLSSLLTFLAVGLATLAVYSILTDLFLSDQARFSRRVDQMFRKHVRDRAQKSSLFKNFDALGTEALLPDNNEARDLRQRFEAMIEQSGLNVTLGQLLACSAGAGLILGIIGLLVRDFLGAAIAVPVGAVLPWLYVHFQRKARMEKLLRQLPDTFDLMARIIRAGQTISQALQAVADEFDEPVAAEFSYCYEQQNLGLPPDLAFRDLARRTGLLELKIFVVGLVVQQQSGGNLAEMLERLAAIVRDRFRIRGKIQALTAEGRLQAAILLALPPFMLGMLLLLNQNYAQVLLNHPQVLMGTLVSEALGALWIRKIVNFDY